jgi:hypothetical protein
LGLAYGPEVEDVFQVYDGRVDDREYIIKVGPTPYVFAG